MKENKFMPTGNDGIEISTGDSAVRVEDLDRDYSDTAYPKNEVLHSQFLGMIEQDVTNIDDDADVPGVDYVQVTTERTRDHEYIHFDYEGGAGFTLRMPRIIRNTTTPKEVSHG